MVRTHCSHRSSETDLLSSPLIIGIQIPIPSLISFISSLEVGYSKYKNPYHNLVHAADVTQTIHHLLLKTGIVVRVHSESQ